MKAGYLKLARTRYIYAVYTAFLAGRSPNIRSYTGYIYNSGQPYACVAFIATLIPLCAPSNLQNVQHQSGFLCTFITFLSVISILTITQPHLCVTHPPSGCPAPGGVPCTFIPIVSVSIFTITQCHLRVTHPPLGCPAPSGVPCTFIPIFSVSIFTITQCQLRVTHPPLGCPAPGGVPCTFIPFFQSASSQLLSLICM